MPSNKCKSNPKSTSRRTDSAGDEDYTMSSILTSSTSSTTHIRVRIVAAEHDVHVLDLNIADIVEREMEMQSVAATYDITGHGGGWSGSRLYQDYLRLRHAQKDGTRRKMEIRLFPVEYCRNNNLCQDLRWTEALTKLIHDFYTTSVLQVEDDMGCSFLLALEYFGILYQPDQLVFGSLEVYKLVKDWSDYLAQRSLLADWVAEQVLQRKGSKQKDFYFATCANTEWEGRELPFLTLPGSCATKQEQQLIWAFFNAPTTGQEMRVDFCQYLQNLLTQVEVSFLSQSAILWIHIVPVSASVSPSTSKQTYKSEISHPTDENGSSTQEDITSEPSQSSRRASAFPEESYRAATDTTPDDPLPKTRYALVEKPGAGACVSNRGKKQKDKKSPFTRAKHPWKLNRSLTSKNRDQQAVLETVKAPLFVVRARSTDVSVLTGPFVLDGNGVAHDVYADKRAETAEALRQEWIQGSVLNRGISNRIRELLDDASEAEDVSLNRYEPTCRTMPSRENESKLSWDWFNSICSYPDGPTNGDARSKSNAGVDSIMVTVLEKILVASGFHKACSSTSPLKETGVLCEQPATNLSRLQGPTSPSPIKQTLESPYHVQVSSPPRSDKSHRPNLVPRGSPPLRSMLDSVDSAASNNTKEVADLTRHTKYMKARKHIKSKKPDVEFTSSIRHKLKGKPSVTQSTSTTAASSRSSPGRDVKITGRSAGPEPYSKKLARIRGIFRWRKRYYV